MREREREKERESVFKCEPKIFRQDKKSFNYLFFLKQLSVFLKGYIYIYIYVYIYIYIERERVERERETDRQTERERERESLKVYLKHSLKYMVETNR